MPFYGRHLVYVLVWPWEYRPFVITEDIASMSISKSVGGTQSLSMDLFPRCVPTGFKSADGPGTSERTTTGYEDVLNPNDWIFVWVDPQDGEPMEPLFLGLVDQCSPDITADGSGARETTFRIRASGWEKALQKTSALVSYWADASINMVTLANLGPMGASKSVGQRAGSADNPGMDAYINECPLLIAYLLETFLKADTTGVTQASKPIELLATMEDSITQARTTEDQASIDDAGRSVSRTVGGSSSLRPIMGQFELPNTGIPLWEYLKLKFENITDQIYIDPNQFLQQLASPLIRLIDQFSNQILNMLIYDVRMINNDGLPGVDRNIYRGAVGGYKQAAVANLIQAANSVNDQFGDLVGGCAPYVIFQRRPLFASELLALGGPPSFHERDFSRVNVVRSDSDVQNIVLVECPSLTLSPMIRATTGFYSFEGTRSRSEASIKRHGLRFYNDTTTAWPGDSNASTSEVLRPWSMRLQNAMLDNAKVWSGQFGLEKYARGVFLGGKLEVTHEAIPGIREVEQHRVYFVDALDYSYVPEIGRFTTSIAVTRGQPTSTRAGVPSYGERI